MINANELRIGNLVQDEYTRTGAVSEFTEKSITLKMEFSTLKKTNHRGVIGLQVDPIPLTVEWLLNLGFKQAGHDYLIEVNNRVYSFLNNTLIYEVYNDDEVDEITINTHPVKYVHQLQNLYFALTGKELEYDNKK